MATNGNDAVFEQVRDAHMAPIYARIRRDAEAAAENGALTPADVFRASRRISATISSSSRLCC